jgi:iron complex transport system permease protein
MKNSSGGGGITLWILTGSVAVLFAATLSLLLGSANIPLSDVLSAYFAFDENSMNHHIVWDLRVPRTIGDILVGAALSTGGAIMQGMTRNPLADSGVLGINSGAVFALSLCLAFLPGVNYSVVVGFSFAGAALALFVVYGLTGLNRGKQSPVRLVLAGIAVGTLLSALSQAVALHYNVGQEVTFWTAGGVAGIRMTQLLQTLPFILAALVGAVAISPSLSLLNLGEDAAVGLGAHPGRIKALCMVMVLMLSGSAVALAGPISFVGLIVPHIVRRFLGTDYRKIIPGAIVLGSLAMLVADLVSRLINPPHETPVGLVFAVLGVPFFLYICRRERGAVGA